MQVYESVDNVWSDEVDAKGRLSAVSVAKFMERNRNVVLDGR